MLAPLLLALQVAASAPGASSMAIRAATSVQRVALVGEATAPMLRPQSLAPLLPVVVTQEAPGRYHILVSGVAFGLEVGVATTTIAGQVTPLAAAPVERNGQLLVPLQLVSEVFPAYVNNLRWNAATHELVIFTRVGNAKRQARLVVVDAGHGGPDNGMTGPLGAPISIYEKDVALAVAKRLGLELKSRGLRVLFTRTTDTLIALSDRGRIANQAGGDLFISVHVNAASLDWKDPAAGRGLMEVRQPPRGLLENPGRPGVAECALHEFACLGDPADRVRYRRPPGQLAQGVGLTLAELEPPPLGVDECEPRQRDRPGRRKHVHRRLGQLAERGAGPGPRLLDGDPARVQHAGHQGWRGVAKEADECRGRTGPFGGLSGARHRLHAGGARGDRLRHQCGRGKVPF